MATEPVGTLIEQVTCIVNSICIKCLFCLPGWNLWLPVCRLDENWTCIHGFVIIYVQLIQCLVVLKNYKRYPMFKNMSFKSFQVKIRRSHK